MYYLLAALVSAVIGVVPLVIGRKPVAAAIQGVATFVAGWFLSYLVVATTVYPLFGVVGFMIMVWWAMAAFIIIGANDGERGWWSALFPAGMIAVYILIAVGNSAMFRANQYASMITTLGGMEERLWTDDIQPKDPAHMRMSSKENARYQAQKILGAAGAIGSQFEVGAMTTQMIGKELMFVAPLDFAGYSMWSNTDGAPGYIKVSGEDPHRQAELVQFPEGKRMRYTPSAYFSWNLERHLRANGYLGIGLMDPTFEIDDAGNPWWVITAFEPTMGWWGEKVLGVVIVNPFTGTHTFYTLDTVPSWVDRVIPGDLIVNYLKWAGAYSGGWFNSWWGKKNLTMPDDQALLIYGTDDQPQWVTDITSTNVNDDSLVALVYTNSRTGKSVSYRMPGGGTTTAILDAVNKNQDVQYKHLHGAAVQLYNVNGMPTAVVPLLNDSHAFQGVALVSVSDIQAVATGRTAPEAVRNFEKLLTETGRRATVESTHDVKAFKGVVDIAGSEVTTTQGTVYYIHLKGVPHLFTAGAGFSPKLPVTKEGHRVEITVYESERDVISMLGFNNLSIPLSESAVQATAHAADVKDRDTK